MEPACLDDVQGKTSSMSHQAWGAMNDSTDAGIEEFMPCVAFHADSPQQTATERSFEVASLLSVRLQQRQMFRSRGQTRPQH